MIERILHRTHHVIKGVPVLRRINDWAVELWFRVPWLQFALLANPHFFKAPAKLPPILAV